MSAAPVCARAEPPLLFRPDWMVREPEPDESPLSLEERRVAVVLAWREVARAPAHFAEGQAA